SETACWAGVCLYRLTPRWCCRNGSVEQGHVSQGHLAAQHIEKLRQSIHASALEEMPDPRGLPERSQLSRSVQRRAKAKHREAATIRACSLSPPEDRTWALPLNR